jgi:hypothetical protein
MNKNYKTFKNRTIKDYSFPSLAILEQVKGRIKSLDNQRGEFLRKIHYGCYILCSQAGLRISEAVKFNLNSKTRQGLYRITKPKKQKERYVYVPKKVVRELKRQNWQPNQTNRWNFYHFLKKIKQKTSISKNVELTPHTLRRTFTTHHAENGTPLPILQKLLGHSSIRTTSLYWQNIYDDNDMDDILKGKPWIEKPKKPEPPTEATPPNPKNFSQPSNNFKPTILDKKPTIKPNSPPPIEIREKPAITSYHPKAEISEISAKPPTEFLTPTINIKTPEQEPVINSKNQPSENEKFLLNEIRELKEQLKAVQAENKQLKIEKDQAEKTAQNEKKRTDYYEQQLKTIVKSLYQWKKINHYQQLEKEKILSKKDRIDKKLIQQNKLHDENQLEAKIEQKPPPWKN